MAEFINVYVDRIYYFAFPYINLYFENIYDAKRSHNHYYNGDSNMV